MKLYIAGPMSGLPEFNYPAFHAAAEQLRGLGYEVESPAEPGQVDGWDWLDYMRRGLRQLLACDGVALLPGWHNSRGATTECNVAESLGLPTRRIDDWEVIA